jgi:hypothetical protein
MSAQGDLPDFHIPHAEKIEWMIETNGWAIEPVPARTDTTPPVPGYAYTIGFPQAHGFSDVVIFGLTPVAARGLLDLVNDVCSGGTEIPLGVPVVGLLDNDLRCVFAPIDMAVWGDLFATATAWYRGAATSMVQLLWPDRNGFLPHEPGFDQRMSTAQPVIGALADPETGLFEGDH